MNTTPLKKRNCYLFVFDGFADWEPALATVGLNQFTDVAVRTVSVGKKTVRSMGNLTVVPDLALEDVKAENIDLLLLPGGDAWDKGLNLEVKPLVDKVLARNKTIAAICAGTGFLARHGYLDRVRHTSNHLEYYLKKVVPEYKGEANYVKQPSVADGNFITASGVATVPFAEAIFRHFNVLEQEDLSFWFQFFLDPALTVQ